MEAEAEEVRGVLPIAEPVDPSVPGAQTVYNSVEEILDAYNAVSTTPGEYKITVNDWNRIASGTDLILEEYKKEGPYSPGNYYKLTKK